MNDNIKLYFVRFVNKQTSECFFKFGITHHYDVLERFKDEQYDPWDIKVMASAYGPRDEVMQAEKFLLEQYPKNLWIEQKIKGVTEIVKLDYKQLQEIFNHFDNYKNKWYSLRIKTAN